MHMVDRTFEYREIMNRAPQIIRGALTLEANSFTLNDAYITLSDEACATCRQRGGFIYLITCERVCSLCLIEVPRWKPRVSVQRDWNLFGAPYPHPKLTPSAIGRPGVYGTAGGYQRPFGAIRTMRNFWIVKNAPSRFWDAKHCDRVRQARGIQSFKGSVWYASQLFVSVSVPLVDR
ncbi:hypothetical protein INS49_004460 [Diaporthe citri]|uniref:uncharacterized protein n=1 Tax=Diaporthe citri TaxID=83186 RepID=UPI001C821DA8|nr:uncharacterized protein INS49_004460 [Diaporthe citri]KAG6354443.1 hypothetical protein INS49_004460 [Diaporthe citri]